MNLNLIIYYKQDCVKTKGKRIYARNKVSSSGASVFKKKRFDGSEDVYTAIIRESVEESGINIEKEDLSIVQVMHRKRSKKNELIISLSAVSQTGL